MNLNFLTPSNAKWFQISDSAAYSCRLPRVCGLITTMTKHKALRHCYMTGIFVTHWFWFYFSGACTHFLNFGAPVINATTGDQMVVGHGKAVVYKKCPQGQVLVGPRKRTCHNGYFDFRFSECRGKNSTLLNKVGREFSSFLFLLVWYQWIASLVFTKRCKVLTSFSWSPTVFSWRCPKGEMLRDKKLKLAFFILFHLWFIMS